MQRSMRIPVILRRPRCVHSSSRSMPASSLMSTRLLQLNYSDFTMAMELLKQWRLDSFRYERGWASRAARRSCSSGTGTRLVGVHGGQPQRLTLRLPPRGRGRSEFCAERRVARAYRRTIRTAVDLRRPTRLLVERLSRRCRVEVWRQRQGCSPPCRLEAVFPCRLAISSACTRQLVAVAAPEATRLSGKVRLQDAKSAPQRMPANFDKVLRTRISTRRRPVWMRPCGAVILPYAHEFK